MPRKLTKARHASDTSKAKTAEEIRQIEFDRSMQFAEQAREDLKLLTDYTKTNVKTISTYNKETLLTYLENIGSNATNLRNLSWYLFYRSTIYRREIIYNANMFYLNARNVVPNYDLNQAPNDTQILQTYYETIQMLDNMNLQLEFFKVYLNNFIQDVFYGCAFLDETGFFILPLPADYCKIVGVFPDGSYAFAMDFTYFRGQRENLIELWGEPFDTLYRQYGGNNAERWQIFPPEYSVCTLYGIEDWETLYPPFASSFLDLVSLEDLKQIQAVADEQEIYKLVYYKLGTLPNAKDVNRFKVDTKTAIKFFNRFIDEAIPDYTSAGMILGDEDLGVIDFTSNDKVNDTTKVAKATKEVLNTMGGAQVLNGATITGAEAMRIVQRVDTEYAISSLLPQTQAIVNRLLSHRITDAATVKFFPISAYTRDEFRETLLNSAQNGFSANILALNSLNGVSEKDTLIMSHLTNDILQIQDMMIPLSTSYTQTDADTDPVTGGRPTEDGEATDKADASQ